MPLPSVASLIPLMSFILKLRHLICAIGSVGMKIDTKLTVPAVPLLNHCPPLPNHPIVPTPTLPVHVVTIPHPLLLLQNRRPLILLRSLGLMADSCLWRRNNVTDTIYVYYVHPKTILSMHALHDAIVPMPAPLTPRLQSPQLK